MKTLSTLHHKASIELLLLAAIWGASFMFMRVGSPEFGPIVFATLRAGIAAIFLIICLVLFKETNALKGRWRDIFVVGALNTAIPFTLFSFATLTLTAGTASVLNATAPMFSAIVAYIWLKDKLSLSAMFGLVIGFFGVYLLVSDNLHFDIEFTDKSLENNTLLPTLAAMLAALCYGISANYTKKNLSTIKPLALAAGSQIAATAMLLPLSLFFIPETLPSSNAIWSVLLIGVICTGVAYILFFRLIAQLGPAKAISVTYLIPAFGILWGALFLGETISLMMLLGGGIILLGVALTTGVLRRK
ncbi:DMT family transporter [Colwellia sp. MB02u-10]|uniref:DMT family transporter n=1 Tax=Colwellia sp. MB02u-10 TaxID=2759828 RepID=UPI002175261B|nr:DMT family transporter [Colwellia sp. MB02u-10]